MPGGRTASRAASGCRAKRAYLIGVSVVLVEFGALKAVAPQTHSVRHGSLIRFGCAFKRTDSAETCRVISDFTPRSIHRRTSRPDGTRRVHRSADPSGERESRCRTLGEGYYWHGGRGI